MSSNTEAKFEEWGKLELFGRQQLAGKISEQTIAGTGFVRIDVPAVGDAPAFTRFFGPTAVYSITPVSEAVAMRLVSAYREVPISRYELPALPAAASRRQEPTIDGDGDNEGPDDDPAF